MYSFIHDASSPPSSSTLAGESPPALSSAAAVLASAGLAPSSFGASSFPYAFPPLSAYSPNFLNGIFLEAKKFLVIISLISSSVSSLN